MPPQSIDYGRCYHHGVRVPDLDAAMAELGPALGVTWCQPQEVEQAVWLPEAGEVTLPLRFTYSAEGPQHVELLEGPPGSIWDGRTEPGLHHVGLWTDDVAAGTAELRDAGWALRLAHRPPDRGYGAFTYLQPPSGILVELVASALQPMFERWFAGGTRG
jgi:catechol 2,3-dioxygenase-like lactoylglutathione lyase family enzyme